MKKLAAVSTSALLLAATSASALEVDWSGYGRFGIASVDKTGYTNTTSMKDWEIAVKAQQEFSNGVTGFMKFELDAQGGNENIRTDDVMLGFVTEYGTITAGAFNNGKVKAGLGLVPTLASANPFGGLEASDNQCSTISTGCLRELTVHDYLDDKPTIAYTSPTINGFTIGVSMSPNKRDGQWGLAPANSGDISGETIGVGYETSFLGADVNAGVAYAIDKTDPTQIAGSKENVQVAGGVSISMSNGLRIAFTRKTNKETRPTSIVDSDVTQFGAIYTMGSWSFSAARGIGSVGTSDYNGTALGVSYALGKGGKIFLGHDDHKLGAADDKGKITTLGMQFSF